MATSATLRAQTRRRARALYDDGYGCNAIARELDVHPSTISRWAKAEGLPFDRSQAAMAVRAHTIDLRASALLLAQKLVIAGHDAVDALDHPYTQYELGRGEGKDAADEWHELTLDQAPIEVRQKTVVTVAVAIDKALKVTAALDEGVDLPAVDQWLEHMTGTA